MLSKCLLNKQTCPNLRDGSTSKGLFKRFPHLLPCNSDFSPPPQPNQSQQQNQLNSDVHCSPADQGSPEPSLPRPALWAAPGLGMDVPWDVIPSIKLSCTIARFSPAHQQGCIVDKHGRQDCHPWGLQTLRESDGRSHCHSQKCTGRLQLLLV